MNDLARLLVRLSGLVVIVWTLIDLPRWLSAALTAQGHLNDFDVFVMTVVPDSLSIIAGLVMFWGAGFVVDRALLMPKIVSEGSQPVTQEASIDFRAIEEIALTVLGFYILVDGLGEGIYYWGEFDAFSRYAGVNASNLIDIPPKDFGGIAAGITRVVLGITMILLSRGLVTLRRRILSIRPITRMTDPLFPVD